MLTNWF